MGKEKGGTGGGWVFKAILRAIVLGIFSSLLLIGNLTSTEVKGAVAAAITSTGNPRHATLVGRKKYYVPRSPDLIGASKRRVPNGSDPIHNRHVGQNQRPSGKD